MKYLWTFYYTCGDYPRNNVTMLKTLQQQEINCSKYLINRCENGTLRAENKQRRIS
jgi:hypothetical protein